MTFIKHIAKYISLDLASFNCRWNTNLATARWCKTWYV